MGTYISRHIMIIVAATVRDLTMNIPLLSDVLGWLLSHRRDLVLDKRESTKALAEEFERLAELMEDLLKATGRVPLTDRDRRELGEAAGWFPLLG